MKNKKASSDRKLAMHADSKTSIHPRYERGSAPSGEGRVAMAMGKSSAVTATKNSDIPSTPRYQEIPSGPNQGSREVNWKPAWLLPVLKATTVHSTKPSSTTPEPSPSHLGRAIGAWRGSRAMARAAPNGSSTTTSKMGKLTSAPHPEGDVRQEGDHAHRQAEGIAADVAVLYPAQGTPAGGQEPRHPVDEPVDQPAVHHVGQAVGQGLDRPGDGR